MAFAIIWPRARPKLRSGLIVLPRRPTPSHIRSNSAEVERLEADWEEATAYTAWEGDPKLLKAADFDNVVVEDVMYEFDMCRAQKGNQYEYEY